jgi:hypothetical protein
MSQQDSNTNRHIFVSYSKEQRDYARAYAAHLIQHGFDVWIDDQIEFGDDWWRLIVKAIRECGAFTVLMTPEADESRWVQREVMLADELRKPMFPLLVAGENWPLFVATQYADVRDGRLPPTNLIERIGRVVPRRAEHGRELHASPERVETIDIPPAEVPETRRRCIEIIFDSDKSPAERAEAGRILGHIGDPRPGVGVRSDGLPQIEWHEVAGGEFVYQSGGHLALSKFLIAEYPVTFAQFQSFIDAEDGFQAAQWWKGLAKRPNEPGKQRWPIANHPRENVSWYDAVAFCRWLSAKLKEKIRLPTEQEWEKAARGTDARAYPWGDSYSSGDANVDETQNKISSAYLERTTAVGIFPSNLSPYGAFDMSGNVWEWCMNDFQDPANATVEGIAPRVLRGGSWYASAQSAQTTARHKEDPSSRLSSVGFRLVRTS